MDLVLAMIFLNFSNANIQISTESFTGTIYYSPVVFGTTRHEQLINKDKFAQLTLEENSETFFVHVIALNTETQTIHSIGSVSLVEL